MRGDRPRSRSQDCSTISAAPHARGSTRALGALWRQSHGCPACAGIDPTCSTTSSKRSRLPRMRGDRPHHCLVVAVACLAAPHARGSTRPRDSGADDRPGCPACAGIDPLRCCLRSRAVGLPRMRGDRPPRWRNRRLFARAAPHARGSTLGAHLAATIGLGCPACAGIDPSPLAGVHRGCGLPRMRGDRPGRVKARLAAVEAAPHARGSTRFRKAPRLT